MLTKARPRSASSIGEMDWRWERGPDLGKGAQKGTELKVCAVNRVTGEKAVKFSVRHGEGQASGGK